MEMDAEISAMSKIADALSGLEEGAVARVLHWAADRFEVEMRMPKGSKKQNLDVDEDDDDNADEDDESAKPAERSKGPWKDLGELYHAANPKTEADKVLIASYWIQVHEGGADVEALRVNNALKNLGHPISSITREFGRLAKRKPALMIQIRKSGKSQQARKKYRVTDAGIKEVEQMAKAHARTK